jgi:hypothetical protein
VALESDPVIGGASVRGTVTLSGPAPAVGRAVTLSSNKPAVATVPSSITVTAGQTSATFEVATKPVTQTTRVTITAVRRGGVDPRDTLTVNPAPVTLNSLSLSPTSVLEGRTARGTVTLSGPAPAGGIEVRLVSSDRDVATVPSSIRVTAGQTSAGFDVTTKGVDEDTTVTITASHAGVHRPQTLTVMNRRPPKGEKDSKDDADAKRDKDESDAPDLDILLNATAEAPQQLSEGSTSESRRSGGQAFIRPEERPEVRG